MRDEEKIKDQTISEYLVTPDQMGKLEIGS